MLEVYIYVEVSPHSLSVSKNHLSLKKCKCNHICPCNWKLCVALSKIDFYSAVTYIRLLDRIIGKKLTNLYLKNIEISKLF